MTTTGPATPSATPSGPRRPRGGRRRWTWPAGGRVDGLRVAILSPYSWSVVGGVQGHVAGLAGALRERGAHVDVLTPADRPPAEPGVVPVGATVVVPSNGSVGRVCLNPLAVRRTARLLRAGAYDVVHAHEPLVPVPCLAALRFSDAPVVGTFHRGSPGAGWYGPFRHVIRWGVPRLAARIAVSREARDYVRRTCEADFRIIPNGIDTAALRAEGEPRDPARIAFIGRPERRKGLTVLLRAFARLPPRARLDLVGVTPDALDPLVAGMAPETRARIETHGFLHDPDRARVLARAGVLCAPSLGSESFGMVLAEGMASGAAVVASAIPGYTEVVDDECAMLVPPGDAEALAARLSALAADPVLRDRLAEAGRHRAERYDWSRVAGDVLGVYREVLEAGPRRPAR